MNPSPLYRDLDAVRSALDMFSRSFKLLVVILLSVLIAGFTYAIYMVGGDWKSILILSAFGTGFAFLSIIAGIRCGKNILTDKEKEDLIVLENLNIIKLISRRFSTNADLPILLRFIIIIGSMTRWAFFLIFLLGASGLFIIKGINNAFLGFCFLAILWFPFLDNLFFSRLNYIVIVFAKLVITVSTITLFAAISL